MLGAQERDLLQMERTVLNSLGFRINTPTAYTFWSVYRLGHAMHNPTASLASYLMVRLLAFSAQWTPHPAACSRTPALDVIALQAQYLQAPALGSMPRAISCEAPSHPGTY